MRILVTGGRKLADRDLVWNKLEVYREIARKANERLMVIEGGCETGADLFAREWARKYPGEVELKDEPAQWTDLTQPGALIRTRHDGTRYDAKAGPRRNRKMLKYRPHKVLAFPGGKGTLGMCKLAAEDLIPVEKVGW